MGIDTPQIADNDRKDTSSSSDPDHISRDFAAVARVERQRLTLKWHPDHAWKIGASKEEAALASRIIAHCWDVVNRKAGGGQNVKEKDVGWDGWKLFKAGVDSGGGDDAT